MNADMERDLRGLQRTLAGLGAMAERHRPVATPDEVSPLTSGAKIDQIEALTEEFHVFNGHLSKFIASKLSVLCQVLDDEELRSGVEELARILDSSDVCTTLPSGGLRLDYLFSNGNGVPRVLSCVTTEPCIACFALCDLSVLMTELVNCIEDVLNGFVN